MRQAFHPYVCLLLVSVVLWGCTKDEPLTPVNNPASNYDASVANSYFELSRKMTKETPGYSPPVAARAYGYTGLALYESVVHGMPGYRSMAGVVNGLNAGQLTSPTPGVPYHWAVVANNAMATFMKKMYSTASAENMEALDALRHQYNSKYIATMTQETYDRSVNYGNTIAEQVYAYSATDGQEFGYQTNFPSSYIPPTGPGFWVPTPPAFQPAMQPYWGSVRPFISDNITMTQPPVPIAYSSSPTSAFHAQALEVYTAVVNATPEQLTIAKYWSDDPGATSTPPGHSISIATQILEKENANLAKAAETYAKVGMAVHDAFISCWKCKFDINLMRPITYIIDHIDAGFTTPLVTPPFPEYTSGHSSQTGAVARVLSDLFGYNYAFTDYTHAHRTDIDGSPRSYSSFYEMANETAISRLYGGIHYREAIELGVVQGRKIGANISTLPFKN
jgi:hypothetical protein